MLLFSSTFVEFREEILSISGVSHNLGQLIYFHSTSTTEIEERIKLAFNAVFRQ
jgi:hypothetical protein